MCNKNRFDLSLNRNQQRPSLPAGGSAVDKDTRSLILELEKRLATAERRVDLSSVPRCTSWHRQHRCGTVATGPKKRHKELPMYLGHGKIEDECLVVHPAVQSNP